MSAKQTGKWWTWRLGWPRPVDKSDSVDDLRRLYGDHLKTWVASLQSLNSCVLATTFIGVAVSRIDGADDGDTSLLHAHTLFCALSFTLSAFAMALLASALRVIGSIALVFDCQNDERKQLHQSYKQKQLEYISRRLYDIQCSKQSPHDASGKLSSAGGDEKASTGDDDDAADAAEAEAHLLFKRKVFCVLYLIAEFLTCIGLMGLFVAIMCILRVKMIGWMPQMLVVAVLGTVGLLSAFAILMPHFVAMAD